MTNPVEAERRFLELQRRLNHNLSYRQQWLEIGDFLSLIEGHFATYDTHCEQLVEQMPVFTRPLSVTGTDPSQFEDILALLSALSESVPSLQHSRNFSEAKEALVVATAFLYLCVHQFESANRVLFGEQPEGLQKAVDIKGYLDKAQAYMQGGRRNTAIERVNRLNKWWDLLNERSPSTLYVPVVEVLGPSEKQGRLRKLTTSVLSDSEKKDSFRNSYSVAGAEAEDAGIRREVIETTRKLLEQSHPDLKQKFFNLQFEYAIPLGLHMGRSSDLACCLSAYSAMLNAVNRRERFEPGDRVAVTGRLGKRSRIEAVEAEGIAAKTRAAFFSWMEYLVVPEKQKHLFMEQLAILKEQYPAKPLKLIGLEEPVAFFYDRRLSEHRRDSMPKYLAQKAWQQKFSLAGIATIVVLLAVIGRLWYGPIDRNPKKAVFAGEYMTILNSQNSAIKNIWVGEYTSTLANNKGPGAVKNMAAFKDLTGDGLNEVIWGAHEQGKEETMQLNAYDIAGDSLIWSIPLSFQLSFPQNSDVIEDRFSVREIEFVNQPDGSVDLIVLLRHLPFFPSLIVHIEADSGTILNEYVHIGHLIDIELHDIDGDGIQEVLAVGINNAFNLACMTVLEVDSLSGHSPLQGTYEMGNYERANEISYVLFPRTVVSMALKKRINNNMATAVNVNSEDKNIEVLVYEVFLKDVSPYEAEKGRLFYFFDFDMNIRSVGSTTLYDLWAKNLYQEGRIPKVDNQYLEAFKDSLVYVSQ